MSLIPSESYSFPDHFTKTVVPSRKPKNEEPALMAARQKKPTIVRLPDSEPTVRPQRLQPASSPRPNPALMRTIAPPARIPVVTTTKHGAAPILKPKAAATSRAPAMDPRPRGNLVKAAPNVIQMQSERAVPAPAPGVQPSRPRPQRPAPVGTTQADFFELFAQNGDSTLAKRCRKMKFRRFVACECAALAVLLPLALIGLLYRPSNAGLLWIMDVSTIASAVAAALMPILFYAVIPTLPEIEE